MHPHRQQSALRAVPPREAAGGAWIELLLAKMSEVHDALAAALAAHERLTIEATSDPNRYTESRWRLGKASLERRKLLHHIHAELGPLLDDGDAARLDRILLADQAIMRISGAHIRRWTSPAIDRDWNGYCAAAGAICRRMQCEIEIERRLLYPLLIRAAAAV